MKCACRRAISSVVVTTCLATPALSQQLPLRTYRVADGLAHTRVSAIYQDSRGFMWFGTWSGLSRFDGHEFLTYGPDLGFEHPIVNAVTEDRAGRLWLATNGAGVARLVDDHPPRDAARTDRPRRFVRYLVGASPDSNQVNALLFDDDDTLWCATDNGLYRAPADAAGDRRFALALAYGPVALSMPALRDAGGRLWFGMVDRLGRVESGRLSTYGVPGATRANPVSALAALRDGSLSVATRRALWVVDPAAPNAPVAGWRRVPLGLAPGQEIRSLQADTRGLLWVGTTRGLIRIRGTSRVTYTTVHGLCDDFISTLASDREGQLWIGSFSGGACSLAGEHIVSFTKAHGLPDSDVSRVIEARDGEIYAATARAGIVRIAGERVVAVRGSEALPFARVGHRVLQDRHGSWWLGTDEALFYVQGPDLDLRRARRLGAAEGLPPTGLFDAASLLEDREGRVWVGALDGRTYRLEERNPRMRFTHAAGTGARMLLDARGTIWLASPTDLRRSRAGRETRVSATEGLPDVKPRALYQDGRGRLWIGLRYAGVSVTDDPEAEAPRFTNYSTRNGLSNDAVWCVTEDRAGRIYVGTAKGLDVLEAATGRARHWSTKDGLAGDNINDCLTDRRGRVWVAASGGVSRFDPDIDQTSPYRPPVLLTRIQVGGRDLPLPERGAARVSEVQWPWSASTLRIEFVGLSFRQPRALRYQYRLHGADADWQAPTPDRAVTYVGLAPGAYRFEVRALTPDGLGSPVSAVADIRRPAPWWRRRWVMALAAAVLVTAGVGWHRARLRRLMAVEGLREQIAADLHDDVGAGLAQVAILAEVARHERGPGVDRRLDQIAALARGMRDSMSDLIWAVNPRRDRAADLLQRTRQVAFDLLESAGVRVDFHGPPSSLLQRIELAPDERRHALLAIKEALTNVARHAGATHVHVDIALAANRLAVTIADDGRGFDLSASRSGLGLTSLRRRAETLGGRAEVWSVPGRGTTVRFEIGLGLRSRHPRTFR